ncbi:signal peptidase I [Clostridium sp. SHJSY1]|uniref:signal peptidase I n=1 Tax=Clostridium sp. SHJSY1 TaxID=2942483 RepID=UPI002875EF93|nr:signal peptidase I [Clostridium sp. SHJSY1]MDS0528446.1 signal peptidase I [Clostridium sp. SHJSY1]
MKNKKKVIKEARGWILSILVALSITAIFNSRAYAKVQVQQSSMENTLHNNQQLIIDKLSYNFTEPKRGDIIIFLQGKERGSIIDDTLETASKLISGDQENNRLVKKVIGIPGDEIDIKDGCVYLNGEKLDEPYAQGETLVEQESPLNKQPEYKIKVEENKLFVLGDNRPVSMDSRIFGLIDKSQVEGKAIFRVYPFNEAGKIN